MTDGGEVKVVPTPINIRQPIPLPQYIKVSGRRMRTKLAAREKIPTHQANGWVGLTWAQYYKATGFQGSPAYQYGMDSSKKVKSTEWAQLRPNMYAMVKPADIVAEENRRAKEKDERRRHTETLNTVDQFNRLSQNATGASGNVAHGKAKLEAEDWAGVPEGKSRDEEQKITKKAPEE